MWQLSDTVCQKAATPRTLDYGVSPSMNMYWYFFKFLVSERSKKTTTRKLSVTSAKMLWLWEQMHWNRDTTKLSILESTPNWWYRYWMMTPMSSASLKCRSDRRSCLKTLLTHPQFCTMRKMIMVFKGGSSLGSHPILLPNSSTNHPLTQLRTKLRTQLPPVGKLVVSTRTSKSLLLSCRSNHNCKKSFKINF